ncbi:Mitochondrial F1F0-ATP synthase, subunit OSCP/ATP5 [Handroanthus impetiginosus]|uniref:Mitochondrial F1F0-ATP synthase, subunit OSCP/ATP5 n=1 Tax=Handroanthus impetiginosus TaxID=429701 RepID=A0A2G9I4P9_9LAMI|nr:Mitochondrial F1F0-ATP synthase, subunit OSCP/ATP5 [Handroanthus impetiginosus]
MAAAAALQQTPVTFQYRSSPSSHLQTKLTTKLFFSSNFKISKLTIKPLRHRRRGGRGGGVLGATMADTAAGSYADALADVAKSNDTLDQTYADVEKVEKIFSDEEVLRFFLNPTIGDEEKRKIVDEISKSSSLQPHVANFVNILVDMNRIDLIKEIVKEFELIYNKLTETELAVVTSVVKLESQHLAQIAKEVQKLTGAKNVRIKTAIDPSLVAGFTIRYGSSGSKLIDMSVKKQLEEIAAQLDIGDIQLAV